MRAFDFKKYAFVFVITAAIFGTAFFISNYFNGLRIEEVRSVENKISVDILSVETQFALLAESSCEEAKGSFLSQEMGTLGEKLAYMEQRLGVDNSEVVQLKKHYSLLQIKDFLLNKRLMEKCKLGRVPILYFYTNEENCVDCEKQGYVLTYMRENYPGLRVYSFDYNINLPAVKTLIAMYKIGNVFPALVVDGKTFNGFQNLETIKTIVVPKLEGADITYVVLSPHLDDAILSLGGFLATHEYPSTVITFFTKKPSNSTSTEWDKSSGFINSNDAISLRLEENRQALNGIGVKIINLQYEDFQYRAKPDDTTALQNKITQDIAKLIPSIKSSGQLAIVGPAFYGNEITNPDHVIIHKAFMDVVKQNLNNPDVQFFLYEDLPYAIKFEHDGENLKDYLNQTYEDSGIEFEEKQIALEENILTKKEGLISAYKSQVKAFKAVGEDLLGSIIKFDKARCTNNYSIFSGCEVFYKVVPN
ncbi:MAG: PIG-L family deacetylase [Patescibacteria group bacterium]